MVYNNTKGARNLIRRLNAMVGFILWSIVALLFLGIGISSRKANEAVGFFTFVKPPIVEDVKRYNNAVAILWFVVTMIWELMGIPFLFLKQNSPIFLFIIFGVVILLIAMMIAYTRIEAKYKR